MRYTCECCEGTKKVNGFRCPVCSGTGYAVPEEKTKDKDKVATNKIKKSDK